MPISNAPASHDPKQASGDSKVPLGYVPSGAMIYLGLGFKEGARKYGAYNWRKTKVETMTYVHATLRHLYNYVDGEDVDPESGNPHLAHALCCLAILADATTTDNLIDDRPPQGKAGTLRRAALEKCAMSCDPLRPARGVLNGVAISIVVYAIIILAWRFL